MGNRTSETIQDYTAGIKSAVAVDISVADADLGRVSRGIYVGGSGDLKVQFGGDNDATQITLTGLAAGMWHPMQVQKVIKTGTTATGIVAGF